MAFTTLAHHIDIDWLREAYRRTRKDGAPGVDGQTAASYEENLEENLQCCWTAPSPARYMAPPVRRVHIPKGSDRPKTRPIGIPTFEDKVLQRAVVDGVGSRLRAGFSGLFVRLPARAIGASGDQETAARSDGDGRGLDSGSRHRELFDTLDPRHLRDLLDQRVRDGVLLPRSSDKWLSAGVMEEGNLSHPATGNTARRSHLSSPGEHLPSQVLDEWFEADGQTAARWPGVLIRFADDFVLTFNWRRMPGGCWTYCRSDSTNTAFASTRTRLD